MDMVGKPLRHLPPYSEVISVHHVHGAVVSFNTATLCKARTGPEILHWMSSLEYSPKSKVAARSNLLGHNG